MSGINLRDCWDALWARLGAAGDSGHMYEALLARYSEPWRAYHNASHIEACLGELSECGNIDDGDVIEFALWFHDAIYDPRAKDNEERSAELARGAARAAGLSSSLGQAATLLILSTRHAEMPVGQDEQVMVDIDLAILGQASERFAAYEQEIRAEYEWVDDEAYRVGRMAVLERFLGRPRIYSTDHFHDRYEAAARANLTRSVSTLAAKL
jgi:predicted metal-dependent HD superfamily phosphohydrolase